MASDIDWLTLAEAKAALNIRAENVSQDTEVQSYITAVSERLDDLVGPAVKRDVSGELHDGSVGIIWPNLTPVAEMTSVSEYSSGIEQVLTEDTLTTFGQYGYQFIPAGHNTQVRRTSSGSDSSFATGRRNVVLAYVAGRFESTETVSPKFKQAAAKMLAVMWTGDQGAGTVTFGAPLDQEPTMIIGFAVPNAVQDLLANEIRPPVIV